MLSDVDELRRFKDLLTKSRDELISLGLSEFAVDDFYEVFVDVSRPRISESPSAASRVIMSSPASSSCVRLIKSGFYLQVLRRLEEKPTVAELHSIFNDRALSEYVVVYLRLLTSGQLQKESDFFGAFIEGSRTLKDFCKQEVEPMYKESDHIHIIGLTRCLSTGVRVLYMDRASTDGKVIQHTFPDDATPR